jgi:rhamnogalacturonyl hydrolase YesR
MAEQFAKNNNFAPAQWARSNAWAAITLTEILERVYPDVTTQNPNLRKALEELQEALQQLQDRQHEGLWRTVLGFTVANGSYVETSASSGSLYTYLKSQRKRLDSEKEICDNSGVRREACIAEHCAKRRG